MKKDDSKKSSGTNWDKLASMPDSDVDFSDIPRLDDHFFKKAKLKIPSKKPLISIRVDADVLDWFKSHGAGYQTRMNAVLRMYMEAHKKVR